MHAIIHLALKKHAESRYGTEAWLGFLEVAGVPRTLPYVRVGEYPDQELLDIIAAIARSREASVDTVLEEFGVSIAPDLIAMYPRLMRPEWRSLDLICHTEQTIHAVVRRRHAEARPAVLKCERLSPTEVRLTYVSARKLCTLARGIIRGVARHYGEVLSIEHPACMLQGAPACELRLRLESGS